jgi:alkylhydroperoxidase family enzyme
MSWLRGTANAPTPFEAVFGLRPELLACHRELYGRIWDAGLVRPGLLELCRLRIAMLHECEAERAFRHADTGVSDAQVAALPEWPAADCFSDLERAALAIADKIPWQPHGVTDAEVATLRAHLSDPQVVALLLAMMLFDAHCRLRSALAVRPHVGSVPAPLRSGLLY